MTASVSPVVSRGLPSIRLMPACPSGTAISESLRRSPSARSIAAFSATRGARRCVTSRNGGSPLPAKPIGDALAQRGSAASSRGVPNAFQKSWGRRLRAGSAFGRDVERGRVERDHAAHGAGGHAVCPPEARIHAEQRSQVGARGVADQHQSTGVAAVAAHVAPEPAERLSHVVRVVREPHPVRGGRASARRREAVVDAREEVARPREEPRLVTDPALVTGLPAPPWT